MKKIIALIIGLTVIGWFVVSQAAPESTSRKIIVFKSGAAKENLIEKVGGKEIKNLKLINAKTAMLSEKSKKDLLKNPDILRIDDDVVVSVLGEVLPWGIDAIDAEKVWPAGNAGGEVRVGVIDTGISNRHPDLLANVKGGVNTINPLKNWNDDNGHGSHVAGIIGAIDNEIGVIGVGPQINIYAIKVLGANGSGYLSDIIEGIQWAIDNKMRVVNMSLGTTANIQSFHDAVIAAKNSGVVVVAAAGNSGGAVSYPAAYPETIAVSAVDQNKNIASWSSRGPEVDLAAPGMNIYSTYKGTGYKKLSGTSMAAPHVAGTAALVIAMFDPLNPDQVKEKLEATAEDLGIAGKDDIYGRGFVNAYNAIQP